MNQAVGDVTGSKSELLRNRFTREDEILKVAGAGDALCALIGERTGYDALWASGLGISAAHAVPDAGILTMTELLHAADTMDRATSLPVIADCDTGFGDVNVVRHMVTSYQHAGIAAVCIEDKAFPKRNSFRPGQQLADPAEFGAKVKAAKEAQTSESFMVIARLESFIAGAGLEDAIRRALCYVECGADAILVHSKSPQADEVLSFADRWKYEAWPAPLVCVPTTYATVTEKELSDAGYSAVIYANQALRAAMRAMTNTLSRIRKYGTSALTEDQIAPVQDLLELIGMEEIERFDGWFTEYVESLRERSHPGPHKVMSRSPSEHFAEQGAGMGLNGDVPRKAEPTAPLHAVGDSEARAPAPIGEGNRGG
jgi:phosphoenolpyruvate phosphomutase